MTQNDIFKSAFSKKIGAFTLLLGASLSACATPTSTSSGGTSAPAQSGPLDFPHDPPGNLRDNTARYGTEAGAVSASVVAPNMVFPFKHGPAFSNSQVYAVHGAGNEAFRSSTTGQISAPYVATPVPINGSEANHQNYTYPWQDNFCEARGWINSYCTGATGGRGHQGQDIRPATCERNQHEVVAVVDGEITKLTTKTLDIQETGTGRIFRYLHTERPALPGIAVGTLVTAGQTIGYVSDVSGGSMNNPSRSTTIHLHFEIWDGLVTGATSNGVGLFPPYSSLVEAYRTLLGNSPGELDPATQPPISGSC